MISRIMILYAFIDIIILLYVRVVCSRAREMAGKALRRCPLSYRVVC